MESGEIDEAINRNATLIPENVIEANQQFVDYLYLNYYIKDSLPTESELQMLNYIALLTPWLGGQSVYSARVLLGIDPDRHGIAYRLQKDASTPLSTSKVKLYPNPTYGDVTIEFDQVPQTTIFVQVNDLTGKTLVIKKVSPKKSLVLELKELKTGTYLIKVSDKDGLIETKLLIKK